MENSKELEAKAFRVIHSLARLIDELPSEAAQARVWKYVQDFVHEQVVLRTHEERR